MGHNKLAVQNIALWLGSGLLGYAIWAFVWRGEDESLPENLVKEKTK